jgi:hypothetical protein
MRLKLPRLALPTRLAAAAALLAGLCPWGASGAAPTPVPPHGDRRLTIFYTAEAHGTLEPCGCTSDPLGDIARYGALVEEARRDGAPMLLVDGGGLSYPEGGIPARERAADQKRAAFLATELERLGLAGSGLAEADLALGPTEVAPRRLAVNLGASPVLAPPAVHDLGGTKVGVLGVADPALAGVLKVAGEDPVQAARREAEKLRQRGAELVVALAPVDKALARRLARDAAVDFVVLGRQVGGGLVRAEPAGRGFLVAPADELQKVGRIDVVLRGAAGEGGPLADAGGPEANEARRAEIDRALGRLPPSSRPRSASARRWRPSGRASTRPGRRPSAGATSRTG